MNKIGDTCLHCKKGYLVLVPENFPWNEDYLWCEECNSTFSLSIKETNG